jgi:hypothetical protein
MHLMDKEEPMDYEQERKNDLTAILASDHAKKVVVAGPGTGKSFLFQKMIEKEKEKGKKEFLAITFIGKLGDALADDLAGLAETTTMHGFARKFVLEQCPEGWEYYPKIFDVIKEDLEAKGITDFEVGDTNYQERTQYYKAVGEDDVVYYAIQACKKDKSIIPKRDLILIDEFQDFNEVEDEFINLLADHNEILVVGDDDQALYKFKGSDPKFIRDKHHTSNTEFESHTLRFCSRCPEVVVKTFHDMVAKYDSQIGSRIKKDYFYYYPDKKKDSDMNPQILVMEVQLGMIALKIKNELNKMLQEQRIKSVLIIGEGRSCKPILSLVARLTKEYGFRNVSYTGNTEKAFSFKAHVVDGYKILAKDKNLILAWRLLSKEIDDTERQKIILDKHTDPAGFIAALPDDFKKEHTLNSKTLKGVLGKPKSGRKLIADSSISKLETGIVASKKESRELLINQLLEENKYLDRPLANLDITVCNILGSKGLGADVVFMVGFDQGKIPSKKDIADDEIYQMLVALTRTKKRFYFINTKGSQISSFLDSVDEANYTVVR